MALGTGDRVGRYVVFDRLGEGAMGVVYRAWDDVLDRIVALKLLLPGRADQKDKARLAREARLAARINHPSVAHIYDVGEHEGYPFIAMEFVPGRQLRAEMAQPLTAERTVFLARQVLDGLAEAHRQGVVHRDLKPENVLLWGRDQVKILDFGLAKPLFEEKEGVERSVGITGTPRYMAPEQFEGRPVDGRTDIYALGAVLYEMLTLQPAHPGHSLAAVLKVALEEGPKPIDDPRVPPPLSAAVQRALAREPGDRFQSAADMSDALRDLSVSESQGPAPKPGAYLPHPRAEQLAARARDALVGFGERQRIAVELSEKAIEIDPRYALPHAILAEACATITSSGHGDAALLDRAEHALVRAEELDPLLPDLRVARARMVWTKTFNFAAETALRELRLALRVDPEHAGALRLIASVAGHVGLMELMGLAVERRLAQDPNDQIIHLLRAGQRVQEGRPDLAVEILDEFVRLDPAREDTLFWWLLAHAHLSAGNVDRAEDVIRAALARRPEENLLVALKSLAWALRGEAGMARQLGAEAARVTKSEAHPHHVYHHLACVESLLGDPAASLGWLRRSAEEGFPCWPWFESDPMLAHLRASPEGAAFLRELRRRHSYFAREFRTLS